MAGQYAHSLEDIKDMLLAKIGQLAYHYAPAVQGSFEDKGRYFTLNPGRADKSVGSFYIYVEGPRAGYWIDHATGDHGDVFDLIKLSLNCSMSDAMREARAQLGLGSTDPSVIRKREEAAARAKEQRRRAEGEAKVQAARRAKAAQALYLSASPGIANTPVEFYLRDRRGIDLRQLGHQPGSIRFVDRCKYHHVDPTTGEVVEGPFPAMVAIVNNSQGKAIACHRTYLGIRHGRWDKADVPTAKKVLGDYAGGWINIWKGRRSDGKRGKPLNQCDPGTRVFVAEGIEDALSAAILLPEERHIAAISLSNLANLKLPANVAEVVFVADQDEGEQAKAQLNRAIAAHKGAGRIVRIWQNTLGGKDLNDALKQANNNKKGAA